MIPPIVGGPGTRGRRHDRAHGRGDGVGGGNGELIVKALRASSLGYTIVGTDMQPYSKAVYEVDIYLVPAANDPSYLDQIVAICRKHDAVALLHGSEPEPKVLSKNRGTFAELSIFLPINPARVVDVCMDRPRRC